MIVREVVFPYQAAALQSTRRIVALISGTGAGKTWSGAIRLGTWALQPHHPGAIYYAVGPTRSQLKSFLWYELLSFLSRIGLREGVDYEQNRTDLILTFRRSGVRIMGKTAEAPDTLQSGHICGAVLDEAGLYEKQVWHVLLQRVSMYAGQLFVPTTPYNWGWLKTEVYDKAIAGDEKIELITVDSLENPFFDEASYYEAKARMPGWRFDMFFRGRFTKPAGLVYETWQSAPVPDWGSHWRRWAGVDYGFTNATAGCLFAVSPVDFKIYMLDCFKESKLTLAEISSRLQAWNCPCYLDPSASGIAEELRGKGCDIRAAQNDVIAGIMYVDDLFRSGRVVIGKCRDYAKFEDELNSYSWATDANGEPVEKVSKVNDHLMDAMRYGLVMGASDHVTPIIRTIAENRANRLAFGGGGGMVRSTWSR